MENTQDSLWKQFNLASNNPAQGGGILYCMRYSRERLEGHQEQVMRGLENIGANIRETDRGFEVSLLKSPSKAYRRMVALLEELSVINEALELNAVGLGNYRTISELKNGLMASYLTTLEKDMTSAYDLVDAIIPQIIRDLKISEKQGKKFKAHEREDIQQLEEFARRQSNHLNDHSGYIIFG